MRIALITDWYHPRIGGIELHLQDLARRLTDAGHEPHVITTTPGKPVVDGIRVHRIGTLLAPHFGFALTKHALDEIAQVLAREHFDVAHCHVSIVSPAAMGGAYRAQKLGLPTVVTFHSVVPQTYLLAAAINYAIRSASWPVIFSAVSQRVARDVQPLAGRNPVHVLPNGIDAEFWRVEPEPHDSNVIELVSVMRLNPKKRPLALIDLMKKLPALLPRDLRARLRIIGDGPHYDIVDSAVKRMNLESSVHLLGLRTRAQIREIYATSDIFLLPTINESFGLAALEARCAGLPVVAMIRSGVAEFIETDMEGFLAHDDADFVRQVAVLARDVEWRNMIAEHNRRIPVRFDWTTVLAQHVQLYHDARAIVA